jgi:hypothetical protein
MDGTKRTAFAAAIYFLEKYGHPRQRYFPKMKSSVSASQ